jgi:hypothetical protein
MENDQIAKLLEFGLNKRLSNVSFDDIEKQIFSKTQDKLLTDKVIKLLKNDYYEKKHKSGFYKLLIGSILLLSGFFTTVCFYHSGMSITVIMYTFTTVGCVLLFWGLHDMIG